MPNLKPLEVWMLMQYNSSVKMLDIWEQPLYFTGTHRRNVLGRRTNNKKKKNKKRKKKTLTKDVRTIEQNTTNEKNPNSANLVFPLYEGQVLSLSNCYFSMKQWLVRSHCVCRYVDFVLKKCCLKKKNLYSFCQSQECRWCGSYR